MVFVSTAASSGGVNWALRVSVSYQVEEQVLVHRPMPTDNSQTSIEQMTWYDFDARRESLTRMPSVSLQDFLSRHGSAIADCSLGAYLASMTTTSFSSRRLRSFEHTWLLAGLPGSASFCLQVNSLVREERARKSRDFFFGSL